MKLLLLLSTASVWAQCIFAAHLRTFRALFKTRLLSWQQAWESNLSLLDHILRQRNRKRNLYRSSLLHKTVKIGKKINSDDKSPYIFHGPTSRWVSWSQSKHSTWARKSIYFYPLSWAQNYRYKSQQVRDVLFYQLYQKGYYTFTSTGIWHRSKLFSLPFFYFLFIEVIISLWCHIKLFKRKEIC